MSLSEKEKNELDDRLRAIDDELVRKHVPIPSRPLVISLTYQSALRINFVIPSEVSDYIDEWYAKKYGSIKNSSPIGLSVVGISGHIFAVELPIIFGSCSIQPLQYIKGLTPEIWQAQNENNQRRIEDTVLQIIRRFQVIARHLDIIGGDLNASATHLLGPSGDYGLSKWSSFQAVEKLIKASLQVKKIKYKFDHNLNALLRLSAEHGFPRIPQNLVAKIKTTAGVRYGEKMVELSEAVNAHYASIIVCATLADPRNEYQLSATAIEY